VGIPALGQSPGRPENDVPTAQIPQVSTSSGGSIRIICGTVQGTQGPVRDIVTDPEYLDVTIPAHSEFVHATKQGHTVFAYVIEGRASFCHELNPFAYEVEGVNYFDLQRNPLVANRDLVLFGDGDQVIASTQGDPARFLFLSGKPLKEPVAWYGPIVMNSREELQVAFEEYRHGTFIKHPKA
jgi:redox-sensitive bicupin YhaK (pirin superfamily)